MSELTKVEISAEDKEFLLVVIDFLLSGKDELDLSEEESGPHLASLKEKTEDTIGADNLDLTHGEHRCISAIGMMAQMGVLLPLQIKYMEMKKNEDTQTIH